MHKKLIYPILIAILFLIGLQSWAQTFPVQAIPQVTPPPPVYLSDYASTNSINDRISLQLLLTDLTVSNREVRLKLYVEGNGINAQSRDFVVGAQPIFIDGGIPLALGTIDLAPYFELQNLQGISAGAYANALPEGLYQFCFEVYDVVSGNRISSKSCTNALLFLNEPPLLNLPQNNINLEAMNPQNIVFQWTPRHINVSNVEYEFSLVEIWDYTMDSQAVFVASPPLYQTRTRATTLLYGLAEPQLLEGKRYAWRVRAIALSGADEVGLFANNGFSEIFAFTYQGNCPEPTGVTVEEVSTKTATFRWQGDIDNINYRIGYRKATDEEGNTGLANTNTWFEYDTNREEFVVIDLEPNTLYEWRIGGYCLDGTLSYTLPTTFTTMAEDAEAYYNCGIEPSIDISNQTLLDNLQVGDVIKAGDFNVKIQEVSGAGSFTGKGFTTVGFLKNIKIALEFTTIQVNTDYQFVSGEIKTVYDPTWSNILDVDDVIDEFEDLVDVVTGDDQVIITVDFDIDEDDITVDTENGQIIITNPETGETSTHDYDAGDTYTITDASGDEYSVDADGNVTQTGVGAEGGAATAENTNGISNGYDGTVGSPAVQSINGKGIFIAFSKATDTKYELDLANNDYEREKYHKVTVNGGSDYYPAHKAVADGESDAFYADITSSNTAINLDSLIFKTVAGKKIEAVRDGNRYKLTVTGHNHYKNEEAIITYKDSTGVQHVLSSFFIHHIKKQPELKVQVVLVNGADDIADLQTKLDAIYKVAAGNFKVVGPSQTITIPESVWDIDVDNGQIDYNGSGIASDYPKELRAIKDYYKNEFDTYDSKTYHIFVIDNSISVTKPLSGFMPKTRQWGFLFEAHLGDDNSLERKNNAATVAAHELGHGVFNLGHPFGDNPDNSGTADTWLMDYANGIELAYPNWAKMSDKGLQLGLFQDDEEGENYKTVGEFRKLEFGANNNDNNSFSFITPAKQIIVLPNDVKEVTKFYGYYGTSLFGDIGRFNEFMTIVPGTLYSFVVGGKKFKADIEFSGNEEYILKGYKTHEGEYYNDGISYNENNLNTGILFGVDISDGVYEYHAVRLNTTGYSSYQNSSPVVSIDDFDFSNTKVLDKKAVGISNSVAVSQSSMSNEGIKWVFLNANFSNSDDTFLLRNKILELKSLYPRFLSEISKNYGEWNSNNICKQLVDGKYESYLRSQFCTATTSPVHGTTTYSLNTSVELPQSSFEWHKHFYEYLKTNIDNLANEVASSIIDYNITEPEDKVKTDDVYDIAYIINVASQNDISQLNSDAILRIISRFVNQNYTRGDPTSKYDLEGAIIKLIAFANPAIYREIIEGSDGNGGIEGQNKYNPSKYLFEQLFESVDDEANWIFFKSGEANRLALIGKLAEMMLKTPDLYNERLNSAYAKLGERVFILEHNNVFKALGKTLLYELAEGTKWQDNLAKDYDIYDIDYEWLSANHQVKIRQHQQYGWYETNTNPPVSLKPFDLVVFVNNSNLSNVKNLMRSPRLTDIPLPALTVVYSSQAATNETVDQSLSAVIDIASLVGSGGSLTAIKGLSTMDKMRKAFLIADMASSGLSITATSLADSEENNQIRGVLNSLSAVTGLISMGDLALVRNKNLLKDRFNASKNLVDNLEDIPTKEQVEAVVETLHGLSTPELRAFMEGYPSDAENSLSIIIKYLKDAAKADNASKIDKATTVINRMADIAKLIDVSGDLTKITRLESFASVDLNWKNIDQTEIWFDANNVVDATSAKAFAQELPTTTNKLYDLVTPEGLYIKFDAQDGRILLGETSGNYHAFAQISPSEFIPEKVRFGNNLEAIKAYALAKTAQLQVISGITRRQLAIINETIIFSDTKVSTLLGRFRPDISDLFAELGSFKNIGLGEVKGGINLLNRPDNYYEPSTWWNSHNKPWLDNAIERGDDIYLATIPVQKSDLIDDAGNLLGAYAQEIKHIADNNYKPKNITQSKWNEILGWLGRNANDIENSLRTSLANRGISSNIIDDIILKSMYIDQAIGNNAMINALEQIISNPKFKNPEDVDNWLDLSIVRADGTLPNSGDPAKNLLNEINEGKRYLDAGEEVFISKKFNPNINEIDVRLEVSKGIVECKRSITNNDITFVERLEDIVDKFIKQEKLSDEMKNSYPKFIGQMKIEGNVSFKNKSKDQFISAIKNSQDIRDNFIEELKVLDELHIINSSGRFIIKSIDW